jgi:hypothetical protein
MGRIWAEDRNMNKDVADAVAELKNQGIKVDLDGAGGHDVYVATAPDGEMYRFRKDDLLKLKAKERLGLEGLQEAHYAFKRTPNL